jgi:MerR family transcriptional regulator, light-induced transcriptional regulator
MFLLTALARACEIRSMGTLKRRKRSYLRNSLSPRELAAALGVSESSLKRWADEGRLAAERTVGGHRRIAVAEAVRFVREAGLSVRRPELLGLPSSAGLADSGSGDDVVDGLHGALVADRAEEARSLIISLYVEGRGLGWIFDVPVREALARVGDLWEHDAAGVFLEHRATETCLGALSELRLLVPAPAEDAPVALGSGWAGDPYLVPSAMAALVLAEAGYAVRNLGADTPPGAMLAAVRHYRPRLVWQSFSAPPKSPRDAAAAMRVLAESLSGGHLLIGGRGSTALVLPPHPAIQRVQTMTELAAFARGAAV